MTKSVTNICCIFIIQQIILFTRFSICCVLYFFVIGLREIENWHLNYVSTLIQKREI